MSHERSRRTVQLGRTCDVTLGKMLQSSASGPHDRQVPYLRSGSLDCLDEPHAWRTMYCDPTELRSYGLKAGDLLVAEGGEVGRTAFAPDLPPNAIFQNSLHRLRLRADGDLRYVRYALEWVRSSGWLDVLCNKTTFGHLTVEKLRQLRIPWPLPLEQMKVADHLDAETARIDALITQKHRLLELFGERRLLLSEKALDDIRNVQPAIALKRLVTESKERHGSRDPSTILSVSIHQGVIPRSAISDNESRVDDFSGYKTCRPGDIVVNRMRAFQGGVGSVRHAGVVSPDYTVLHVGSHVSGDYLHYVMRSRWFVSEMTKRLRGIGSADQLQVRTPRVNFADLGLIEIPVPSIKQQEAIAQKLAIAERYTMDVIDGVSKQISLLNERRRTLIISVIMDGSLPG